LGRRILLSKSYEQILVVRRFVIFNDEKNAFNGFIGKEDPRYREIVSTFAGFEVKRRGDMEEDPSYKQLISYVLIKSEQDESTLVYKRLGGGGERSEERRVGKEWRARCACDR